MKEHFVNTKNHGTYIRRSLLVLFAFFSLQCIRLMMTNHRWQTTRHQTTWRTQNRCNTFKCLKIKTKRNKMKEFLRTMLAQNISESIAFDSLKTKCTIYGQRLQFYVLSWRFGLFNFNFISFTLCKCACAGFYVRIDATHTHAHTYKIAHPLAVNERSVSEKFSRGNKLFGIHYTNVLWTTQ